MSVLINIAFYMVSLFVSITAFTIGLKLASKEGYSETLIFKNRTRVYLFALISLVALFVSLSIASPIDAILANWLFGMTLVNVWLDLKLKEMADSVTLCSYPVLILKAIIDHNIKALIVGLILFTIYYLFALLTGGIGGGDVKAIGLTGFFYSKNFPLLLTTPLYIFLAFNLILFLRSKITREKLDVRQPFFPSIYLSWISFI